MSKHQETFGFDEETKKATEQTERDGVRKEYRARLAAKLDDPEFRKIEGFPIGSDEAILALSDPPYYTACPNPFIEEWLAENAKPYDPTLDTYHREPFASDVSEGKNDPIYNAHSYHTKVPHKAIMRYILHYTEPGDVVYDGFCGTGMTGVAAQMCGDKAQVESLGYIVDAEGNIWTQEAWKERGNQEERKGNQEERNAKQEDRKAKQEDRKAKQEGRKPENQEIEQKKEQEIEQKKEQEKEEEIEQKKEEEIEQEKEQEGYSGSSASSPGFLPSWVSASAFSSSASAFCRPFSKLGARKAILNDLSPAATFIAYNYNTPVDAVAFEREAKRILKEVEEECGWMYSTLHDASEGETERIADAVRGCQSAEELRSLYKSLQSPSSPLRDPHSKLQVGRINYTVWSDVLVCANCGGEIVFWDAAFDPATGRVSDEFACPGCRAETTKRQTTRATVTVYDEQIKKTITRSRQVAVLVNYGVGKKRHERKPNSYDLAVVDRIAVLPNLYHVPSDELPYMHMTHERAKMAARGVTHVHHFYSERALRALAALWARAQGISSGRLDNVQLFTVEQTIWGLSKLARYVSTHFSQVNQYLNGVYYLGSLHAEVSPWYILDGKVSRLAKIFASLRTQTGTTLVSVGSCATPVAENQIDYIFTDPPFGENIYYADLNYLIESWHGLITDSGPEAIVDQAKKKQLVDYQEKMTDCFRAYYRALKPGRWMTVEFSNSSNAVWNAIQEGLERAGFVVADTRILDKQSGSYRQITSAQAVKQDLVISCYKPHHAFVQRFKEVQGETTGVVEFLREHMAMLPVAPINKAGRLETVAERTRFLLFDRMIAYHLQRGARIPLSASEFYTLLDDQFVERDEMYFLPEQAARYDAVKARGVETEQLSIFVRDEKTAVQWVRSRLAEQPQTLGDLTPKFMQELREWDSHEPRPELRDLLREYFVETDGLWRVPDPNSERDIEAMRRSGLLRLFREYTNAKGQLKVFRKEAMLEGFRYCWETQQYGVIVTVCEKIPSKILQEIQDFVMMYDVAQDLAGSQEGGQQEFRWE